MSVSLSRREFGEFNKKGEEGTPFVTINEVGMHQLTTILDILIFSRNSKIHFLPEGISALF